MPEEVFSFLEIQTPLENVTPRKPNVPLNPGNFETPPIFQTQNGHPPSLRGGGGSMLCFTSFCSSSLFPHFFFFFSQLPSRHHHFLLSNMNTTFIYFAYHFPLFLTTSIYSLALSSQLHSPFPSISSLPLSHHYSFPPLTSHHLPLTTPLFPSDRVDLQAGFLCLHPGPRLRRVLQLRRGLADFSCLSCPLNIGNRVQIGG